MMPDFGLEGASSILAEMVQGLFFFGFSKNKFASCT